MIDKRNAYYDLILVSYVLAIAECGWAKTKTVLLLYTDTNYSRPF